MQRMGFLICILFIPWLNVFSHTWNCPGSHGNVRSSVAVPERSRSKPEAHGRWVNNPRPLDPTVLDDWCREVL
jgi:hypothetical protein